MLAKTFWMGIGRRRKTGVDDERKREPIQESSLALNTSCEVSRSQKIHSQKQSVGSE